MVIYEVWGVPEETSRMISTASQCSKFKSDGTIQDQNVALYSIRSKSWSEAISIYDELENMKPEKAA